VSGLQRSKHHRIPVVGAALVAGRQLELASDFRKSARITVANLPFSLIDSAGPTDPARNIALAPG
jgi:hypothetical protein